MVSKGTVREWHGNEGWGVVDSEATPGGCWTFFTGVDAGHFLLSPGQQVEFEWELAEQDGFQYRALRAWPAGTTQ